MGFFDRFRKKQKTGRPEETAAGPASVKAKPAEAEPVEPDAGDIGGESLSIGMSKNSLLEEMSFPGSPGGGVGYEPDSITTEEITKEVSVLGIYDVVSDAVKGGMGSVWKVHHKGWNIDLAMKRPHPRFFSEGSEKRKSHFISECESWINLGLHLNIVSCYYVREIGGVPSVFSEWMDNGSLKDRIDDGSLYETADGPEARLLDIVIQFARGLRYAHESHLIHQDVKPANLLLTKEWEAKVADFGLAQARAQLNGDPGSVSGYTPAYCAPEQLTGGPLTRQTDIYSWAVSVLEMYYGSCPWKQGAEAGKNCETYFAGSRVPVPEELRKLLAACLSEDPGQRPEGFAEIEEKLLRIYRDITGTGYPRPAPETAADIADSFNNRALSFLDLGKTEDARSLWDQTDEGIIPWNVAFNKILFRCRQGELDAAEALEQYAAVCRQEGSDEARLAMCRFMLEANYPESAKLQLQELEKNPEAEELQKEAEELTGRAVTELPVTEIDADFRCDCIAANLKNLYVITYHSTDGGLLKFYDISGEEKEMCLAQRPELFGKFKQMEYLELSHNGTGMYAASYDDVSVIGTENAVLYGTFRAHFEGMHYSDDDMLTVAWAEKNGYVFRSRDGMRLGETEFDEYIFDGAVNEDIALFSTEKSIFRCSAFDGRILSRNVLPGMPAAFRARPDGEGVCVLFRDGTLCSYDFGVNEPVETIRFPATCHDGVISRDCVKVLLRGTDARTGRGVRVSIGDVKTGRITHVFGVSKEAVLKRLFTDDDITRIVTHTADSKIRLFSAADSGYRAPYLLSRVRTTEDMLLQKEEIRSACDRVYAYLGDGNVREAAELFRTIRSMPAFEYDEAYLKLSRELSRVCGREGKVLFVPVSGDMGDGNEIEELVLCGSGRAAALEEKARAVVIYDTDAGTVRHRISFSTGGFRTVRSDYDSRIRLLGVPGAGDLLLIVRDEIWRIDIESGEVLWKKKAPGQIRLADRNQEGGYVLLFYSIIGSGCSESRIFRVSDLEPVCRLTPTTGVERLALNASGTAAVFTDMHGNTCFCTEDCCVPIGTLEDIDHIEPDAGRRFAVFAHNNRIWKWEEGGEERGPELICSGFNFIQFGKTLIRYYVERAVLSPDEDYIFLCCSNPEKSIAVFDMKGTQQGLLDTMQIPEREDAGFSMRAPVFGISPEEDYILAGSSGRAFRKYMLDWNYTVRES